MPETLKEKTAKGLFWGGLSSGLQQLMGLVFGIFLARLLTQDDYGMVGMLAIFSSVASTLQEGGFISALNKKKEVSARDYNAVFWFSLLCSLTIYVLLFLSAPLIARFYGEPDLVPLARYIFVGFVLSSLGIAPRAWLFRNMKNKESAIVSFTSLAIGNTVGVLLAWNGLAYWAIATQTIVYVGLFTLLCYYFAQFRPTLHIDLQPIRGMIGFGSKLIITNLFIILNNNLFAVIFGRLYTKTEVGNFSQGRKWTDMGTLTISNTLGGIAQPVLARVGDDPSRQLQIFRKLLRFTAFVSFPAMLGLCLVAEELIVIAVTEKWLSSVPFMQWLCVSGAFTPISLLFGNLLVSRGRSDVFMWSTVSQSLLQLCAVCLASPWGMMCMLRAFVAASVSGILIWWYFVRREIGLTLITLLRDLSPYLLLSALLVFTAWQLTPASWSLWWRMAIKILMVALPYTAILWFSGSVILRESIGFFFYSKKGKALSE